MDVKKIKKNNNINNNGGGGGTDNNKKYKKYGKEHPVEHIWYKVCKICHQSGNDIYWTLYPKLRNRYFQKHGSILTTAFTTLFVEALIGNPIGLTFNSGIIGIIVEETVTLNDINIVFVCNLIYDNVVGDSGVSYYLFNNLKWFENI